MSDTPPGPKPKLGHPSSIRVTRYAHQLLTRVQIALQRQIELQPHEYPGYAGRRATLSDTIVRLCLNQLQEMQ